jgi:cytosine/adenosine deaminase-related metal-dependent hydrolase
MAALALMQVNRNTSRNEPVVAAQSRFARRQSLSTGAVGSNVGSGGHCAPNLRSASFAIASDATGQRQQPRCGRRIRGEKPMMKSGFDRRTVLAATTALTATSLMPRAASAQANAPGQRPAASLPARGEFVVRGAHVLSMDDGVGDLPSGDVHVRDGAIVAVGPSVNAPGAQTIDGKGMICMPGFVDTHWHHWTSMLRPLMRQDDPKFTYFPVTAKAGVHYTAQDSYRSVKFGVAQALAAGVTTTQNWAHNVRSPAHADAEMAAMRDAGIRGRFAYGNPLGAPNEQPMDLADLARAKRDWVGKDGMLTLGICSRNVDGSLGGTRGAIGLDMARKEWGAARDLGLPITLHTSGVGAVKILTDAGLLGPDLQLVHPLGSSAQDRAALAKHGVSYSTSPTGEARRPGDLQFPEMMEAGVKLSLSIDHTTTYNCDCFVCMRMLYTLNIHRLGPKNKLTAKRLVQLATIDGARDLGFGDKTGSLTPGKRADLILIRTTDVNLAMIGDPYEALVTMGQPDNIDTVVVDGRVLRRNNKFTALDYDQVVREAAEAVAALKVRANWPS